MYGMLLPIVVTVIIFERSICCRAHVIFQVCHSRDAEHNSGHTSHTIQVVNAKAKEKTKETETNDKYVVKHAWPFILFEY